MSRLTDVLGLLYKMERDDVDALAEQLLTQRKRSWVTALTELAREMGCSRTPRAPSGRDLDALRRQSTADARMIARTWNREVTREIARIYEGNPRGNRYYYMSRLEQWSEARNTWKAPQIALNTAQQTRFAAQQAFYDANGIRRQYVFTGPPPVCEECVGHFGAGVVGQNYVDASPAPVHVNCPHEWKALPFERIPCQDLWLG